VASPAARNPDKAWIRDRPCGSFLASLDIKICLYVFVQGCKGRLPPGEVLVFDAFRQDGVLAQPPLLVLLVVGSRNVGSTD
jgi:hypothetical protein